MALMSEAGAQRLAVPQCEKCGSTDVHGIKMFSLSTDRVGTGAVVGAGGGHIGAGLTTMTSQTSLALSLKPGREPGKRIAGSGYLIGIGLVVLASFIAGGIADALGSDSPFGITVAVLIIGMIGNYLANVSTMERNALKVREAWNAKRDLFERGWVCLRCGHTWIPIY
jgi:hypothetical protein